MFHAQSLGGAALRLLDTNSTQGASTFVERELGSGIFRDFAMGQAKAQLDAVATHGQSVAVALEKIKRCFDGKRSFLQN
jgi:hypothetical protein